ncbi:conjugative transfer signal peptidase TraF [Novosphingobium sp. PP1Y]|uniref:conjugative transfer signal peptidase TraF n=1 Tax=Novosphingobium sp. PP1Y TaxID=702113 RepID=UPI0002F1CB4F|nr:conjugative transfer signal peptidase TraF [Novosphingobium sp. PP1Y]
MTRRRYFILTLFLAGGLGGSFATVAWLDPRPRLIWNASASAPIGLYRLQVGNQAARGDLVAIMPPRDLAQQMAKRRYLANGMPMLKRIAALPGQTVCRHGANVSIDGARVAVAHPRDRSGRPLPVWRGCHIVLAQQLFVINAVPDSFDSRYFGPIPDAGLIGRAQPLFTRDAPDEPPVWRGLGHSTASPTATKDHSPCR